MKMILLILFTCVSIEITAQKMPADGFVRIQKIDVTLEPGKSMEEFINFYNSTVLKAYKKNIPEVDFYIVKAIRGKDKGQLGILWYSNDQKIWYKYHMEDGSYTDVGKKAREGLQPAFEELAKIATIKSSSTDWIIK
ncbi:MAG: hypothetical protein ACNS60_03845 [Candidatus Cyclobacteriaceae bacterium M2_1C_046]